MVLGNSIIRNLDIITPFNEENLQPASYDLTVGEITGNIDNELLPGEVALISTKEWVQMPDNTAGLVRTRSSLARMGLSTDFAGWIDPGYKGNITLLIKNLGKKKVDLSKIDRFAQLIFLHVAGVEEAYNGNYQESSGIVRSVLEDGDKLSNCDIIPES